MPSSSTQFDPDRLFAQLNVAFPSSKNNPQWQLIYQMIGGINKLFSIINSGSGGGGGGGIGPQGIPGRDGLGIPGFPGTDGETGYIVIDSGSGSGSNSLDYVVASDGVVMSPSPLNDGAGNFIYIPYIP